MTKAENNHPSLSTLKILVSGASGFVGGALVTFLKEKGHDVHKFNRFGQNELNGFDIVIHLAGENIASRWCKKKKEKILNSRREGTRELVKALLATEHPPKRFICASGVHYYGDHGAEIVDESSERRGGAFLSEVCAAWEEACFGIETTHLRFGLILSPKGGVLKKILPIFRLGLGGILGGGQQYVSWVTIDDVVNATYHIVMRPEMKGPFNIVSPNPVTNEEFTRSVASSLGKTIGPRVPAFILKIFFSEMADELLLSSVRAVPTRLLNSGYRFCCPEIQNALKIVVI